MFKLCALLVLLVGLCGCSQTVYPAIASDLAQGIKSGTPLSEIEKLLGEPHAPTSAQERSLSETLARMPDAIRKNAERDKSLAWGNDEAFLVVKVNAEGIAWATAWRSGSSRPSVPR
jgi:hypothetical protein